MLSWTMIYFKLVNFCAMPCNIDWHKSMHFTVESNVLDYLLLIGLHSATIIMEYYFSDVRDNFISNNRWQATQKIVLSIFSPTSNHVKPLINELNKLRYICWIIL